MTFSIVAPLIKNQFIHNTTRNYDGNINTNYSRYTLLKIKIMIPAINHIEEQMIK